MKEDVRSYAESESRSKKEAAKPSPLHEESLRIQEALKPTLQESKSSKPASPLHEAMLGFKQALQNLEARKAERSKPGTPTKVSPPRGEPPRKSVRNTEYYQIAEAAKSSSTKMPQYFQICSPLLDQEECESGEQLMDYEVWEVVADSGNGGIPVSIGMQLSSPEDKPLSTGALVRRLELEGDRLKFNRLTGSGPDVGWVTWRLDGKEQVSRRGSAKLKMFSQDSRSGARKKSQHFDWSGGRIVDHMSEDGSEHGLKVKLFRFSGQGSSVEVSEVPLDSNSLNQGDSFVLDAGSTVYVWHGEDARAPERLRAETQAEDLTAQRPGLTSVMHGANDQFWELLGGRGPVRRTQDSDTPSKRAPIKGLLFRVCTVDHEVVVREVVCARESLNRSDCFVLEAGPKIYVWRGEEAQPMERYRANILAESIEAQNPTETEVTHKIDDAFWEILDAGSAELASTGADAWFHQLDQNGDGGVDRAEFAAGLSAVAAGNGPPSFPLTPPKEKADGASSSAAGSKAPGGQTKGRLTTLEDQVQTLIGQLQPKAEQSNADEQPATTPAEVAKAVSASVRELREAAGTAEPSSAAGRDVEVAQAVAPAAREAPTLEQVEKAAPPTNDPELPARDPELGAAGLGCPRGEPAAPVEARPSRSWRSVCSKRAVWVAAVLLVSVVGVWGVMRPSAPPVGVSTPPPRPVAPPAPVIRPRPTPTPAPAPEPAPTPEPPTHRPEPAPRPAPPPPAPPAPEPTQAPALEHKPTPRPEPVPQPAPPPPKPTLAPAPVGKPTPAPEPAPKPTHRPTEAPTSAPKPTPAPEPAPKPTRRPAEAPTSAPKPAPEPEPAPEPTHRPTEAPTSAPKPAPAPEPAPEPTHRPTEAPTSAPKPVPTPAPTLSPSEREDLALGKEADSLWRKLRSLMHERKGLAKGYEATVQRADGVAEEAQREERRRDSAEASVQKAGREAAEERARLAAARAAAKAAEAARRRREKKADLGPVERWLDHLPYQQAVAVAAAVIGGLGILGPVVLVRFFMTLVGSAAAGLLMSACMVFLTQVQVEPNAHLLDSSLTLLEGKGPAASYWLWLVAAALGLLRYLVGFECALYAYVDDVHVNEVGKVIGVGNAPDELPAHQLPPPPLPPQPKREARQAGRGGSRSRGRT